MLKFTKDNIIDGAIEYIARKTKDKRPHTVRVPLTKIALDIIEKYKDDNRKELLPFISKQKYNDYIKMCFKKAELTRLITVLDPRTRTNVQMRLCDFVTSHTARKTFISILYEQVQDPNLIGVLSGHVEGSKAFAQYRHIDEERKRKTIELLE
jgi:integrase